MKNGKKTGISGSSAARMLIVVFAAVAAVVVLTAVCNRYFYSIVTVSGSSMEPSMKQGERWIIDRNKKDAETGVEKGDIVTFYSDDRDSASVSRVIAVGGDSVYIDLRTGIVYVNGTAAYEPYVSGVTGTGGAYMAGIMQTGGYSADNPVIVPDGYVFVMGDNRGNSRDSREFGPVSIDKVFGVILTKIG